MILSLIMNVENKKTGTRPGCETTIDVPKDATCMGRNARSYIQVGKRLCNLSEYSIVVSHLQYNSKMAKSKAKVTYSLSTIIA